MKTLVVEDDPSMLHLFEIILQSRGHEIAAYKNAEAAWQAYQRENYPLVILDWLLPGMDGLELCRQIRGLPNGDRSVILVATVRDELEDLQAVLESGADDYLSKPVDVKLLNVRLTIAEQRVLDRVQYTQTEGDLKESQKYARNLIDSSLDIIIAVDKDRKIFEFNQAAQKTFGYSREETLGTHIDVLYEYPDDGLQIRQAIKETGQFAGEVINRRKNGQTFPSFLSASTIQDTEGKSVGVMGISRDITEQKRAEKALHESMEREIQAYRQGRLEVVETILHNIGNAINSVTTGIGTIGRHLSKDSLTAYLLSLADAVEAHQDNFAGYVTNDPQGQQVAPFIISLANDFRGRDEALANTVSRVRDRAAHIAEIVRSQKALSRGGIHPQTLNLNTAINDAISILQDSIAKRGIETILDCADAPENIHTQSIQFHQMVVNLVKNSIEAIDEQARSDGFSDMPFIRIKCYAESNSLILEVSDNGIGIDTDQLDVIFQAGYTTKASGTGLGLYSIVSFVNRGDGEIHAESAGIGKGATMRIMLPLSVGEQRIDEVNSVSEP